MREPIAPATGRLAGSLKRSQRLLIIGSLLAAAAVLAIIGMALWQSRADAFQRAQAAEINVTRAITTHVDRHLQKYDAALELVVQELQDPGFNSLPPGFWSRMLLNIANSGEYIGSILVLNEHGDIVTDSAAQARVANFADRDYFKVHQAKADFGTYISQPYQSRLRNGDWSIGLSRRLARPDGSFGGIVLIAVRLEFIRSIMRLMVLDPHDVLVLLNDDGRVLMRQPSTNGEGDVGLDLSASPNFRRIRAEGTGTFTAVASIDQVERMYSFTRVPDSNLIVNVGIATEPVFTAWRQRSLVIAVMAALVSAALVALAALLRRELHQRAQVEAELEQLATTDALTGLANRRRFDEVLQREWRRAARTNTVLSVMMIDADHFKRLNDRHGHAVGDEMLKLIAGTIDACARRPGDLTARVGGEEFAMILPDTGADGARMVAEQIRQKLAASSVALSAGRVPASSLSMGIVSTNGHASVPPAALLEAADRAVYAAKHAGRDRVMQGELDMHMTEAEVTTGDAPATRH